LAGTFYWHDYETFGRHPGLDRAVQFAGVRTDEALEEQGEPLQLLCQPPEDYLPHPEACLVHGISPQRALAEGVSEREFVARIHVELARPGTCGVGYNNLRFDDEFTRHALFRNFIDPYRREWARGNSRWDLLDVMRMARLLRPEGIEWPDREDGVPSFRLEDLTRANGIEHTAAHDALADVRATLALARRLRSSQPRLFDYALKARDKRWVLEQLDLRAPRPLLHVSGRFPASRGSAALVLPLVMHPVNRSSVIACNLGMDIEPLLSLDAASIRRWLYTRHEELPAGMSPVPLKEIHANRCPLLAPEAMLTPEVAQRCGIDHVACRVNAERLLADPGLAQRIRDAFSLPGEARPAPDPEADLYGAFLEDPDRQLADRVARADGSALAAGSFPFEDMRMTELLFRYRARNFPETLSAVERAEWREHCRRRLHGTPPGDLLNCEAYFLAIDAARERVGAEPARLALLEELGAWGKMRCRESRDG
jgi:exodeoxyribonuclease-1